MTEPTDDELAKLFTEETGFDVDDFPAAILDFARAALRSWGQPSGAGEAAEHYRNAIASACEGWTMPDGLRKHLEDALWNPPTPQPTQTQPVAREPLPKFLALKFHARRDKKATVTLLFPGHEAADAWVRGIKGGQHG